MKITIENFSDCSEKYQDNFLGYININYHGIIIKGFKLYKDEDKGFFISMPSKYVKSQDEYYSVVYFNEREEKDKFEEKTLQQLRSYLGGSLPTENE